MPQSKSLSVRRSVVLVFLSLVGGAAVACAQPQGEIDALRKEIAAIKATQVEMQKQLDEIKALLRPPSPIVDAPPGMLVPIVNAPVRGSDKAGVVLLEFTDFECPFCARFTREAMAQINAEYIRPGRVRHALLSFPLEAIHKNAFKAHEAALCANAQGKFWPMYDRLFANPKALTPTDLMAHATAAGLDTAAFKACLDQGAMAAQVRSEMQLGQRIGVRGTPALLIGTPDPSGQVVIRKAISGAHPFGVFKEALDAVLAGK